jgi:hypothetical protein
MIPEDKLDWAMQQVENSLKKQKENYGNIWRRF